MENTIQEAAKQWAKINYAPMKENKDSRYIIAVAANSYEQGYKAANTPKDNKSLEELKAEFEEMIYDIMVNDHDEDNLWKLILPHLQTKLADEKGMDKEHVIALIKGRIEDEYRKHQNGLVWAEIAARKLYSQWSEFFNKPQPVVDTQELYDKFEYDFKLYDFCGAWVSPKDIVDWFLPLIKEKEESNNSEWISVEERLPEENEIILSVGNGVRASYSQFVNGKFQRYVDQIGMDRIMVIEYHKTKFWQPLPSPPINK